MIWGARKRSANLVGAFKILMMEGDALELENGADVLMSSERLSNDSPVMWPDQQHFC